MGIEKGEVGFVQLLSQDEFENFGSHSDTHEIQEWFFKKKALILAFRLLELGNRKEIECQNGDGVFWFKKPQWLNNGDKEHFVNASFILFVYKYETIASAQLRGYHICKQPIEVNGIKYNGYYVFQNIKIFNKKDRINKEKAKEYFILSSLPNIAKQEEQEEITFDGDEIYSLGGYYFIRCEKDFNIGEKICQEAIDGAEELSKNNKWKTLENAPEWFKNIEEFCKF